MISTSRRKVLKLLGLTPMAGPLAAKMAADSQIAKLAGVALEVAPAMAYGASGGIPQSVGGGEYERAQLGAAEYVKMFGLPEFARENMWRNSQYVGALDPDLAVKRSWSMSVKIAEQRQRNFKRNMEQLQHNAWHSKGRAAFKSLAGFDWPW